MRQFFLDGVHFDPERVSGFQKHAVNLADAIAKPLVLAHLLSLGLARVARSPRVDLRLHVPALVVRARADFRVFGLPHRVRHRGSDLS